MFVDDVWEFCACAPFRCNLSCQKKILHSKSNIKARRRKRDRSSFFFTDSVRKCFTFMGGDGGGNEQLALHEKYIDEKCYNSNSRVFFFKIEMNFYIYILLSFFSELPIVKIVYQNPCALFAFQREWPPLQLGKRLKAKS